MSFPLKAKLGVALLGIGGANGASAITFSDSLNNLFSSSSLQYLSSSNEVSSSNSSLDLSDSSRSSVTVKDSGFLDSPHLYLQSKELDWKLQTVGTKGFKESLSEIQIESAKEAEIWAKWLLSKKEAQEILKQLTPKDISYFLEALHKIKRFSEGDVSVEELTKEQRTSIHTYYKVWWELTQRGIEITDKLFTLEGVTVSKVDKSKEKRYEDLKKELEGINWNHKSLKVLGTEKAFVKGESDHWGWEDWSTNPWKPFFSSDSERLDFWKKRDSKKTQLFQAWYSSLPYYWWDDGCFTSVNNVEYFKGCYPSTVRSLGTVIDRSNSEIGLQTGKQILTWMGYSFSSVKPK
ncbi:hypothetical protein MHLP_03420 [Candidatus Mycoplasma haematolamae str. Purdue]|uniref:Lipoprotein n=1 Tax=Mycoplasma haematolamae (strain Purdue) TaxID=1212765 RepID=I7CK52_MYCHA|nr:hypothetical protein [Candidatus Mycoplasma haematolamae]AFO52264.1 hypothetical protein MHLP_03420 [Candidatus Mycoplasma haematolamae str. Purdue]